MASSNLRKSVDGSVGLGDIHLGDETPILVTHRPEGDEHLTAQPVERPHEPRLTRHGPVHGRSAACRNTQSHRASGEEGRGNRIVS